MAARAICCACGILALDRTNRAGQGASFRPTLLCDGQQLSAVKGDKLVQRSKTFKFSQAALEKSKTFRFSRAALINKGGSRHVLDDYKIRFHNKDGCLLGEGAYSKVYIGIHRRSRMQRAVKVIPKEVTNNEQFKAEIQHLIALDHPHIVQIVEYFEDADNFYIVQELITGPDVVQHVVSKVVASKNYYPEDKVSIIMRQVLQSVVCCHTHGIIHRDLKPENFMITGDDNTVKMIDFGLAIHVEPGCDKLTEISGSYRYMAPEMIVGRKEGYSKAVDVWSLGVMFYTLLTVEPPFPEGKEEVEECLRDPKCAEKLLEKSEPLQIRQLSGSARDLLERMLEYDPQKRITPSEVLLHPFIAAHFHKQLDGRRHRDHIKKQFDNTFPKRLERFSEAPRLKRIALLAMAHILEQALTTQLMALRHMFRLFDSDGIGTISFQALSRALEDNGIEVPSDFEQVFNLCLSMESGGLTFLEFTAFLLPEDLLTNKICKEVFDLLDRDDTGALDAKCLALVFEYGLNECEDIIREASKDGSDTICYEEFHVLLRGEEAVRVEEARSVKGRSVAKSKA